MALPLLELRQIVNPQETLSKFGDAGGAEEVALGAGGAGSRVPGVADVPECHALDSGDLPVRFEAGEDVVVHVAQVRVAQVVRRRDVRRLRRARGGGRVGGRGQEQAVASACAARALSQ